jgi:hypothetical protein
MPPTTRKRTTKANPAANNDEMTLGTVVDPYAPTAWGENANDPTPTDLTVPSGQRCLVRRPGLEQLLREGVLFETDTLTTMVYENVEQVEKGKAPVPVDFEALMSDPEKFDSLMSTVDRITVAVVVKPRLERPPNDITLRKEGVVYVDSVALEDKFAILDFALGGSRGLAGFPGGPTPNVGGVPARQGTRGPAKRTPRRK